MKRRKWIALFLSCVLTLSLLATCGGNAEPQSGGEAADTEAAVASSADDTGGEKILIAYFAVAENSDVDAISSASVLADDGEAKGLSKFLSDIIAERTGGELFSIRTEEKFPGEYEPLANHAKEEQNNGVLPVLTSHIENLDEYDTVFIGYPVWWYTLPQVMLSFFEEYDFSGKTLIPFCTHLGSRSGGHSSVSRNWSRTQR